MVKLDKYIRDIPDFPKKGIIFKDITPLLQDSKVFKTAVNTMTKVLEGKKVDVILGIESRGFIFGSALAYKLNCGFVPVRKPGKLPYKTYKAEYSLEYGKDILEVHRDAVRQDADVLIVDDLLATGGTAKAVVNLAKKLRAKIQGVLFLIELSFLNGRKKLKGIPVYSLIKY